MGAVASMTGFARGAGEFQNTLWRCEIKSVNARGLEMRFRTPHGFDDLEVDLRNLAKAKFARGSFSASITIERETTASPMQINDAVLQSVIIAARQLEKDHGFAKATSDGLLALRGVMEVSEETHEQEDRNDLLAAIKKSFSQTLDGLQDARCAEGKKIAQVITDQLNEISKLTERGASLVDEANAALLVKIRDQLKTVLDGTTGVSDDRIAEEAAILAVKSDIREELDRLRAHIEAGRELLSGGGAIGRQFDFLSQELNREANTLCAKAPIMPLKRVGLDLKQIIDQLREQIQNIE